MVLCQGITKSGRPCMNKGTIGNYCKRHCDQDLERLANERDQKLNKYEQYIRDVEQAFIDNPKDLITRFSHFDAVVYYYPEEKKEGIGICDSCNRETFVIAFNNEPVTCLSIECMENNNFDSYCPLKDYDLYMDLAERRNQIEETLELMVTETIELVGLDAISDIFTVYLRPYIA